jgi:hypothetical protein
MRFVFSAREKIILDKLADGYDTKLTAFEVLIPALILSFEKNNLKILYTSLINKYSKKNGITTLVKNRSLSLEWVMKLDPIIQTYVEQGQ